MCGKHFLPTDYRRSLTGRHILASGTILSVPKSQNNTTSEDSPSAKRLKPETVSETPESNSDPGTYRRVPTLVPSVFVFNAVEHDTDTQRLEGLENELAELRAEAQKLRKNVSLTKFGLERFSVLMIFVFIQDFLIISAFLRFGRR